MNTHQPRQVEWNAPWRWSREALQLITRRPWAFSAASIAVLALFFAIMQMDGLLPRFLFTLFLPPLAIVGFARLSEAADRSQDFSATHMLPSNKEALQVLALAITGYSVIFGAVLLMGAASAPLLGGEGVLALEGLWRESAQSTAVSAGLPVTVFMQALLFGASIAGFAGLLIGLGAWFALPLLSFNRLGLRQACMLSLEASRLNARGLTLSSCVTLACAIVALLLSVGLLAVLVAPFAGAMLYVSYRDVFLGQAQNAPALARAGIGAALTSRS